MKTNKRERGFFGKALKYTLIGFTAMMIVSALLIFFTATELELDATEKSMFILYRLIFIFWFLIVLPMAFILYISRPQKAIYLEKDEITGKTTFKTKP